MTETISNELNTVNEFKINLKPRFVAYLDVLGFRALVESDNQQEKLQKYFSIVEKEIPKHVAQKPDLKIEHLVFSDTIILAAEGTLDVLDLRKIIICIRNIQFELAKAGIFLRGGLTYGPLHLDTRKNQIVGKALNRSFDLEKLSKYPRVIIDPEILNKLNLTRSDFLQAMNSDKSDESQKYLIFDHYKAHGISEFPADALFIDFLAPLKWVTPDEVQEIYLVLKSECNRNQENYLKYRWVIDYVTRFTEGPTYQYFHGL